MFNIDEKFFMNPCHDHDPCKPAGHFPKEKPSFTMTEEMNHTMIEMRATIDRLLRFEQRVEEKASDLMRKITSDNVIFKNTFAESYNAFLQEVKNEVNIFEGNVDNSIILFTKDIEARFSTLVDDNNRVNAENLKNFTAKLDEAIAFMKTNIGESIRTLIGEMYDAGDFAEIITGTIFTEFEKKTKDYVTPENYGAIGDGIQDDTAAFIRAVESGKSVYAFGTYKVTSVTLPKHIYGKATILGDVVVSELNTHIEGITVNGVVNWNARNSVAVNCHFNECAFTFNSWANCFINCNWWKSPIFFASVNGSTNNFVGCYFGGVERQFFGTPSNIHITNGWIEECEKVFDIDNGGTIFGIVVENCDLETCHYLVNVTGGVYTTPITFSNCAILGNSLTTRIVGTEGTSLATNNVSIKLDNCFTENVIDFTGISNINLGLEGLHQQYRTKNVPYEGAVNVAWTIREPLHSVTVPDFDVVDSGDGTGTYIVKLPKPCFVGTVTATGSTAIIGDRAVNGAFVTTEREGGTATFNSTCYGFKIKSPYRPTVTLTTPSEIY